MFIKPVLIAAFVFIVSCLVLDETRKVNPDAVLQPDDELDNNERTDAMKRSLTALGIGSIILIVSSKYLSLHDSDTEWWCEIFKLVVMFFVSDTMFYWSHRVMHLPGVFDTVHDMHHTHDSPITWTSLYVSWWEFAIALLGIFLFPSIIFRMHWVTWCVFLSTIMLSLVVSHCGMKIPYFCNAQHHDEHHLQRCINYGSDVGIWDWFCGTKM